MRMILCRHNGTGRETEFPESAVSAWREIGWVPVGELQADAPHADAAPTMRGPAAPTTRAARTRAVTSEE